MSRGRDKAQNAYERDDTKDDDSNYDGASPFGSRSHHRTSESGLYTVMESLAVDRKCPSQVG